MKKLLMGIVLMISTQASATEANWRVMADWHKASNQARSAFFSSGKRFSDMPARLPTAMRLAMFTAANAVEQEYTQYLEGIKAPEGADATLAAAAAASHVLITGFGDSARSAVMAEHQKYLKNADPAVIEASAALGKAAAEAAMARAQATVKDKYPHYKPQTSAGVYITPHMPAFPPSFLDQKPWFLSARDSVRAAEPPALESETWVRDFNEVKRLGGKHNSERTKDQAAEALFWVGQRNEMILDQVAEHRNWSLLQTARLYAMLAMAEDDSRLAVAESKYHHNFWRPITAIRRAELDGSEETTVDPGWEPFRRTPNHPEYPCAHCTLGGSTAGVLEGEVTLMDGEKFRVFDPRKPEKYTTIRRFKEFEQRMSNSRIYIGAHYRSSNEAGELMGRTVAKMARERFAVPLEK